MQKVIAKGLSLMFHPILMPTIGLVVIFNSNTYLSLTHYEIKKILYGIILIGTCLIPMLIIPFLIGFKLITTVELPTKRERILPLIITSVSFLITFYFIQLLPFPVQLIIKRYILSTAVSVIIAMLISIRWKISTHTIGLGGITGLILSLSFGLQTNMQLLLIITILISGLIGTARLILDAHSPVQVFAGYLTGMAVIIGGFML